MSSSEREESVISQSRVLALPSSHFLPGVIVDGEGEK